MSAFVIAGLVIGLFVGMAVQRFRTAYNGWRSAIAAVPKARSTAFATGREAFIWVAVALLIVVALARTGG